MIKRTVEVSGPDTHLSLRYGQVLVKRDGEQIGQFPAEDVGILIVDSPTTTYTHGTLMELVSHGAVVVLEPVALRKREGPLFVELERVAASLARCLAGESDRLELPELG